MTSKAHQFIADFLATKMYAEGYEVVSFEGENSTENVKLKLPPKILRHRPDLIGIKKQALAIGEAKTASDLSLRTREQLEDFTDHENWPTGVEYKIFFGIPMSIEDKFRKMIKDTNINESNLAVLTVPDRLLPYEQENSI